MNQNFNCETQDIASKVSNGQGGQKKNEDNSKNEDNPMTQEYVEGDGEGFLELEVQDNRDEEEGIKGNIQHVSKTGDLSPRHTECLTTKRGKPNVPLQVQTRSNKGRFVSCDQ